MLAVLHYNTLICNDGFIEVAGRRRYTASLALNSVVGAMVGLGDRHSNNIMLHSPTGEIAHIDYGVCFGSGLLLNIPELIPFRLTRDILHPLGISGVEGGFRQNCERVLSLLRTEHDAILPVIHAITRDPIATWMAKVKSVNRRSGKSGDEEEAAEKQTAEFRAGVVFRRCEDRLAGRVQTRQLSVQHQVNYMIQEATDLHNLAEIFAGWAPWL